MKSQLIKAIDLAIENLREKEKAAKGTDESFNHYFDIRQMEKLKNYLEELSKVQSLDFYRKSGSWLGTIREWIQRKAYNGEQVTWGSNDWLKLKGLTVADMELLASQIAAAAVRESINSTLYFIKESREIKDVSKDTI